MITDPVKRLAWKREWRSKNKEHVKKYDQEWRIKNRERRRSYVAKYRKEHIEQIRAYMRYYMKKRRAKGFKKDTSNNERKRTGWRRGKPSNNLRQKLMLAQNFECKLCLGDLRILGSHMDHVIPYSKGGSNLDYNFQLLCPRCNQSKSNHLMVC